MPPRQKRWFKNGVLYALHDFGGYSLCQIEVAFAF